MSSETLTINDISEGFSSSEKSLSDIRLAFIIGLGVFLLSLPSCRSKKSFFDVIAARKVMKFVRTLVFLELCCLGILFYFYLTYGSPIVLDAQLSYGNNQYNSSWIYGFPRPTAGTIFIGVGLFCESHPIIRGVCLIGCLLQISTDCLSAYQIYDYRNQQLNNSAPAYNGFTSGKLLTYYYRDIASIALSTCIFLFVGHAMNIIGWFDPQTIHPSLITGKDYDRYSAMKRTRGERIMMERMGVIESNTVTPGWNMKMRTNETTSKRENKTLSGLNERRGSKDKEKSGINEEEDQKNNTNEKNDNKEKEEKEDKDDMV